MASGKCAAYNKGVRKELGLVRASRQHGLLAGRMAGSKSGSPKFPESQKPKWDVIVIDKQRRIIRIIQVKDYDVSDAERKRIFETAEGLEGMYKVEFGVQ